MGCKIRSQEVAEEPWSLRREKALNAFDKLPSLAKFLMDIRRESIIESSTDEPVSKIDGADGFSNWVVPRFQLLGMQRWIWDRERPLGMKRENDDGIHWRSICCM